MKYIGNTFYVVLAIIVIVVAGATYYWDRSEKTPAGRTPQPVTTVETPPAGTGPKHPMPEAVPDDHALTGKLVELPGLEDSDTFFLEDVASTFGPAIESLLLREAVIDRLVATIDNLPRANLSEKVRPVASLEQMFVADPDADTLTLGISSYARFDAIVAQIYYANIDSVFNTYQRFYPLFQQSYEQLGYPDGYFNDRLVEVIDHLVATPTPDGPIVLTRPNVLYEFADPDLEALSSGQKLMLRMGPDNSATLKRLLGKLRDRLTATD